MKTLPLILSAGVLLLVSCKKAPEPQTEAPAAAAGYDDEEGEPSDDDPPTEAAVNIDDRLASLCGLPDARFEFNSSKISKSATDTLDALAQCMIDGAAKEESVQLVGHADPRGEENYNLSLGQRRAGSVAKYLAKAGVPKKRASTTSRGELDASGSDEDGWASDRRVDILLAN